uniref:DUF2887 domain-containing protein n=1 Tax=uncultured Thiodictyon sp. TaxID=1846217 RepID=UPI0025E029BF
MKTDHPIYLFLSAGAEAFRVLTGGQRLVGEYRFCSLTIKGLERRLDAIFEPDGHSGPAYVVEFQGQGADTAWYNLLTKVGLYGEQHPKRDVIGIGVFLRERDAPGFPHWANGPDAPVLTAALDRFLPQWLAREPGNPYVAVFAPLMIDRDDELRARAPQLWRTVQTASGERRGPRTALAGVGVLVFRALSRTHREGDLGDVESGNPHPRDPCLSVD